jgi:hypothetical protein
LSADTETLDAGLKWNGKTSLKREIRFLLATTHDQLFRMAGPPGDGTGKSVFNRVTLAFALACVNRGR